MWSSGSRQCQGVSGCNFKGPKPKFAIILIILKWLEKIVAEFSASIKLILFSATVSLYRNIICITAIPHQKIERIISWRRKFVKSPNWPLDNGPGCCPAGRWCWPSSQEWRWCQQAWSTWSSCYPKYVLESHSKGIVSRDGYFFECLHQCCGFGMFIPDPGSWFYPSRIPDPGSRIPDPKTATKERGEKKLVVIPFYLATNFKIFLIILALKCWRKKFGPIFKEF